MNLCKWSGFPGDQDLQAIAIANNIEEARNQVLLSFGNHQYYDFVREFVKSEEPVIYSEPAGWVKIVGAQLI